MASLEARLQAAFGGLPTSNEPAWQPTAQQIFRSGPIHDGNSSDEEWEEKERREAVPGLAQALVAEDEPDAEGFRPSTAFCRQLDAEEEYNEVDEVAMGNISRHRGEGPPPRDMQVLDDNIYEERLRLKAVKGGVVTAPDEEQPSQMEVEVEAVAAPPSASAAAPTVVPAASLEKKRRVSFQAGTAEPASIAPRPRASAARQGVGGNASRVPEYVKHPEKFTCYTLDEPLVVGGGVAQLAEGHLNQRLEAAAVWVNQGQAAPAAAAEQEEEERWEGPPGSIPFVSRQQRAGNAAGGRPGGTASEAGASQPPSKKAGPPVPAAICVDVEEEVEAEGGVDVEMVAATAATNKARRQYRASRSAGQDAD